MKLRTKSIITLVAMLLSGIGAFAADGTGGQQWTLTYLLDGEASTEANAGTVVGTISGSTATLTVTPAEGNYITKDQITVVRTIAGDYAHTRSAEISSPVEITATSQTADPSGKTTYTFDASDPNFSYEVTANFQSRIDVKDAQILLTENEFEYKGGEAIEPEISVTYNGVDLTADKEYTVSYSNNNNAGQGVVTITGVGMYKGEKSGNFVIKQASVAIWFEKADGSEANNLSVAYGETFTEPVLKLDPAGVIEVTYSVNDESVAKIDPSTGKLTILKTGTVEVTAAAAKDYASEEGSNYNATPENTTKSYSLTITKGTATLAFSTETATATMGQAFTAPTLSNPNNLAVTYSSSKETVATISEEGVVTIVGEGETTIKATFAGNDTYEFAEASYTLTVSKDKATLAYSTQTATATMGQAFTAPTLNNPNSLAVTYSSSKETVATISEEGVVTIVGEGETTIKATFAGNDKYEPAEASYKLTVSSKATMEVSATGYEGVYDGNAHGITVTAPEGATVKYGTEEGKYDLTENPTYTNVGTYTVYYQVTKEGTETVTGSAKVSITKATATLKFSAETATATLGAEFQTPTLTVTPEGLEGVKYTSSNSDVATVHETTGAVTLVAEGETTITAKFAGNDNYKAAEASYTLTVNRAQSEGYGLWINDIQVTEDNYFDVLGNSTDSKSGTIVFNPEKNTLVMTNDVSNVEIESRLESLTLHINDVNKVKSIRFNNLGDATKTGKLAITTNGNFPGQIIITNDAGVSAISGFSEITLNMGLQYLEPELVEIENGELYKYDWDNTNSDNPVKDPTTKAVCDAVTIGVVITPLTKNVTVSMTNASNYTAKDENGNTILDENGNPKTVSMMNFAQNKDILLTLWTKNDEDDYQKGNDGDWPDAGFDNSDGDPGITMVITMTDAQALAVAASVLANTIQPGGTTYSMEFKGATFIVPAGSGEIDVWVKTDPGYVYKLLPVGLSGETHKLDFNSPSIKEYQNLGNGKIKVTVEYNDLPTQTYYMLYLAEEAPSGARGGTRLGKRDKAHGKLYSVGVRPRSITDVNPPSEASGGVIDEEEDPEGVIDNPTPPTPPTGIQTVASESSANSNKWFTADGRQLEGRPTKPGFYIRNGKKVILK